jgi:lysophospholipase L1-like esterase
VEPTLSALIALTQQDDNNGRRPSPAGEESRLVTNLAAGKKQHIVAYGTSLTAGGAWVKQLEEALNKRYLNRVKITNSGGGGCNSAWGVEKLQSRVIDLKPDAVFVEFAINDSVERFHLPLKTAKANLETMIDRIQKNLPDCLIILQVMNPVINRPKGHRGHRPHLDDYYQMYRDVAAERKLALVDHAPSWKVVLDQGKDAFREFVPDGLHPNAEGCKQIVTPNILKALKVEKAEPKTSPDKPNSGQ